MSAPAAARESMFHRITRKARANFAPASTFFRGFLKHPGMVGAVFPSSRRTVRHMLSKVDWTTCRVFVEYGPGVGTFTRSVLDRLRRDGVLIVIDTNADFIAYLDREIPDPRFIAVHGSAATVEQIVQAHGFDHADIVLSGLPFSTLPEGAGPAIMVATHRVLRPGGGFLVYQYTARARDLMRLYFKRVETGFEPWNLLPCVLAWGWKETAFEPG